MAQYAIKDSLAPVIITGVITGNFLRVYVVSDLLQAKFNVNARIQVYNWSSLKPVHETQTSFTMVQYCPADLNLCKLHFKTFNFIFFSLSDSCSVQSYLRY